MKTSLLLTGVCALSMLVGVAVSAFAATSPCQQCYNDYDRCVAAGTSESLCNTRLIACLRRGDGVHPCPL